MDRGNEKEEKRAGDVRGRKAAARHIDPYGKRTERESDEENEGVIEGRNAVIEALRAGVTIDKVYIAKGERDKTLGHIASSAKNAGAAVVEADKRKLDAMSRTHAHQGVIAVSSAVKYAQLEDILEIARQKGEQALIIVCDEITDPHNMGAIIRTAEAVGAHGVVIPRRRSAGINAVVAKASSGAVYHIAVSRVTNLTAALKELKEAGVWVYGAAADGEAELWGTRLDGAAAIVIGSEGRGISRLVRETCDYMIRIPMSGEISSLNASVSAAVIMYEALRQRRGEPK